MQYHVSQKCFEYCTYYLCKQSSRWKDVLDTKLYALVVLKYWSVCTTGGDVIWQLKIIWYIWLFSLVFSSGMIYLW